MLLELQLIQFPLLPEDHSTLQAFGERRVRTFVRFLEEQHLVDHGNLEGMAFIRARVPKTLKVFSQLRNKLPTGIPTGHHEGIWTIVYCLVVGVCDGSYCDFTSKQGLF